LWTSKIKTKIVVKDFLKDVGPSELGIPSNNPFFNGTTPYIWNILNNVKK
jgi:hypothetical protein